MTTTTTAVTATSETTESHAYPTTANDNGCSPWYPASRKGQEPARWRAVPNVSSNEQPDLDTTRGSMRPWVLWFGAYSSTRVLVWAAHLSDALEVAAEWCTDNAPGVLAEPDYEDAITTLAQEADRDRDGVAQLWRDGDCPTVDAIQEHAEADMTSLDGGKWLLSYEWGISADPDNLSAAQVYAMFCATCEAIDTEDGTCPAPWNRCDAATTRDTFDGPLPPGAYIPAGEYQPWDIDATPAEVDSMLNELMRAPVREWRQHKANGACCSANAVGASCAC